MNHKKIKIDKFLIVILSIISIISFLSIYSASMYLSKSLGNLVLKQILWYSIGIILIIIIFKFKLSFFIKISPYIYLANCLLLIGLLFFAPEINGSKCWYVISGVGSFQPSEFMKISLLLMEVYIIDKFKNKYQIVSIMNEFKLLFLITIIFLIPSLLTFLEPDTGAVIIYFIITLFVLIVSGIRLRWFFILGLIIAIVASMFFGIYFLKQELFIKLFGSDFFYRIDRVLNWKNGSGMQLENSLLAIASSGLLGYGFNNTPIYFPEAGTDFIFTVYSSNFGLVGSIILIALMILLDIHIIKIAIETNNNIYKYVISGIIGILAYQQIQNISMTIGLLPITGITLPFVSYGGSSLLAYMILIGFCLYIYNEKELSN
ncbi:MAG: FtsW/RodA/SpoVE family cell cycle protein [bacterium]|nr:FtsW/RodA/SpoVE family cell cycle protein [bacterium]